MGQNYMQPTFQSTGGLVYTGTIELSLCVKKALAPMPSPLEAQIAVAKIRKYASSESGDTVEVVERPHGGISIVVADGQRSGRSAKTISNLVVRKAISLLAEGVRDGAVARATHDYLRTHRGGKVSAELEIVSVDLVTRTLVIGRNSRCPAWLRRPEETTWLTGDAEAIGIHPNTKPDITEAPLVAGMTLVVATDGIWSAGRLGPEKMELERVMARLDSDDLLCAQSLADGILAEALRLDQNRPRDDATVLVLKILAQPQPDEIRTMQLRFPIS